MRGQKDFLTERSSEQKQEPMVIPNAEELSLVALSKAEPQQGPKPEFKKESEQKCCAPSVACC